MNGKGPSAIAFPCISLGSLISFSFFAFVVILKDRCAGADPVFAQFLAKLKRILLPFFCGIVFVDFVFANHALVDCSIANFTNTEFRGLLPIFGTEYGIVHPAPKFGAQRVDIGGFLLPEFQHVIDALLLSGR